MAGVEQRERAAIRAADIVEQHDVDVEPVDPRVRRARAALSPRRSRAQVIRRPAGGHEHQPLDLPPEEVGDELALTCRISAGVAEHDAPASVGDRLFDSEREVAVVRVAEVRDGDADETARLSWPEASRILVAVVAEFPHRSEHLLLEVGTYIRAAGECA